MKSPVLKFQDDARLASSQLQVWNWDATMTAPMPTMEILCSLPPKLVGSRVFGMLGLKGVIFLHTAATSHQVRPTLKICLHFYEAEGAGGGQFSKDAEDFSLSLGGGNDTRGLAWFFARNIRVKSLLVYLNCPREHLTMLRDNLHLIDAISLSSQLGCGNLADICAIPGLAAKVQHLLAPRQRDWIPRHLSSLFTNLRAFISCNRAGTQEWHAEMIRNNPHLELYENEDEINVEKRDIVDALVNCPNMTSLTVKSTPLTVLRMINSLQKLQHLNVAVWNRRRDTKEVVDVTHLACPHLLTLKLAGEMDFLPPLLRNAPLLTSLTITSLKNEELELIVELSSSLTNLRTLAARWEAEDMDIVQGAHSVLTQLTSVDFGSMPKMYQERENIVNIVCTALHSMGNLQHLNLGSWKGLHNKCWPRSVFCALAETCSQLQSLELPNVNFDCHDALLLIAQRTPNMEKVVCRDVPCYSDTLIAKLAACWPRLQWLEIWDCEERSMTDDALVVLGQHCPRLRRLELMHNLRLTDRGVLALLAGCRQLQYLTLFGDVGEFSEATRRLLEPRDCPRRRKAGRKKVGEEAKQPAPQGREYRRIKHVTVAFTFDTADKCANAGSEDREGSAEKVRNSSDDGDDQLFYWEARSDYSDTDSENGSQHSRDGCEEDGDDGDQETERELPIKARRVRCYSGW